MANESGPDSRPISVAELLARSQGADSAEATRRSGDRGRRRVGREGTVSVSELTGEIPRVGDDPTPPAGSRAQSQPTRPAPARSAPDRSAPDRSAPAPASGAFPRSTNPVARRGADDRAVTDRDRTDPDRDRPVRPSGARSASGMPGFGAPPMSTRDFSADAVAQRLGGSDRQQPGQAADDAGIDERAANAVTGIIPVVDGPDDDLVVVDSDDVVAYDLSPAPATDDDVKVRDTGGFAEVMDDFEAYRSFADVEDQPAEPKKKRRWFGRKKDTAASESTASESTTDEPVSDRSARRAAAQAATGTTAARPVADAPATVETSSTPASTERSAWAPPAEPVTSPADSERDEEHDGLERGDDWAEFDRAEFNRDEFDVVAVADPADRANTGTADHSDTARADVARAAVPPARAADPAVEEPADTFDDDTVDDDIVAEDTVDDDTVADHPVDAAEQSPTKAWLIVIGQIVAGLAIGIGLFWGFTELWKWSVYFALVLAVVVIFGIVTFAHLVRRTRDLPTTLLALGVGLLVTIGPLVLLASR